MIFMTYMFYSCLQYFTITSHFYTRLQYYIYIYCKQSL